VSRAVRRSLEEAGRRPVPRLDVSFADRLEARLLAVAASAPPPLEPLRGRSSPRLRPAIAASGLAAAVLALALVAVLTRPVPSVELIAPSNVQVALEDGTILEDPGGLLLPEGAVVTVGPHGSARVGETMLVPGDVATIRDGRLLVRHDPTIGVLGSSPATATPRPTTTLLSATPTISADATMTARPVSTPSPEPTPATSPQPTSGSEPSPEPATAVAATPAPTPATLRPRLRVRLLEGRRIAVTWTATWGADRYVLLISASRAGPAPDPTYPGSRILGEFAAPPDPRLRFRVPDGVKEVRLMVVALRQDGSVLRRSRVVTITMPASGDTAGSSPDPSATPIATPTPSPAP
jgi:hypothetical protein